MNERPALESRRVRTQPSTVNRCPGATAPARSWAIVCCCMRGNIPGFAPSAQIAPHPRGQSLVYSSRMAERPNPGAPKTVSRVKRLGKYELLARIGVGGMAEVYLARQRG